MSRSLRRPARRALLIAGASGAAILLAPGPAAADWFGDGEKVEGSGRRIDDTRTLGSFNAIRLEGPFDLELVNAPTEDVVVHGDDNLVPMVLTRLDGQTLVIDTKRGSRWHSRRGLSVTIHFRDLNSLMLSGSGDVKADRISTRRFDTSISGSSDVVIDTLNAEIVAVSLAGSGDFKAAGTAQTQAYNIAGSGDVMARDLQGETVAVRIAGSGDASVYATGSLEVSIAGSGDVSYRGTPPKLRKSITGSGSVSSID